MWFWWQYGGAAPFPVAVLVSLAVVAEVDLLLALLLDRIVAAGRCLCSTPDLRNIVMLFSFYTLAAGGHGND